MNSQKRRSKGEGRAQEERKKRRCEGKAYVNTRNTLVQAKQEPKDEVRCKCKFHCKKVPHAQKITLFNDFYGLKDNVKQNSYLMGLLVVCNVRRRKNHEPENSRRQATICFSLPSGTGDIVQVCKKTFMEVFAITKRRIETLVKAKKNGELVYTEKRGNKIVNRKYSRDHELLVTEHINSIPREVSHYSRQKTDKEYLSQDLNINRIYRAFKEKYPDSEISYRFYYETFKKKFPKLRFHHPRTDTCSTCDLLHMQTKSSANKEAKTKLELHHRKAENARKVMQEDNQSSQLPTSENCTISIDLEQVLSLPTLTHSDMFYMRQLSCYNLCIHIGDNNKGNMFLWHEGITGRGGNEVASCVFKATKSQLTYKRSLTIWSDNCIAQNKNKMLLFLWIYLIGKGYFDEINQKYLVSGHSFLNCDRDFAQIEKRKRLEKCEVLHDLVKMMVTATPRNPFIVTVMQPEDFFDFKTAAETTLTTSRLKISKAQWIKVSKDEPGVIKIRQTLNDLESWTCTKIFKKGITMKTIKDMNLASLPCTSRITDEKKVHLEKMIPYLKEENRAFLQSIVG